MRYVHGGTGGIGPGRKKKHHPFLRSQSFFLIKLVFEKNRLRNYPLSVTPNFKYNFVLLQFLPHISKEGVRKFDTRHMEHCHSSDSVLRRQTIERRPDNDRHRLRAMPPATGLVASGSDKVLKTNSDEYLSHVRISNVCARRAPMAQPRLQSAF